MSITNVDELAERIARAAATDEGFSPDHPDHEIVVGEHLTAARRLALSITEEANTLKAEALREAAERAQHDLGWSNGGHTSTYSVRHWLHTLATEHPQ